MTSSKLISSDVILNRPPTCRVLSTALIDPATSLKPLAAFIEICLACVSPVCLIAKAYKSPAPKKTSPSSAEIRPACSIAKSSTFWFSLLAAGISINTLPPCCPINTSSPAVKLTIPSSTTIEPRFFTCFPKR